MTGASVIVTFDYSRGIATLKGLGDPIEKKICLISARLSQWWNIGCVEFYLADDIKWSFIWEEWAGHEQFFALDKYAKPAEGRPGDESYNPWSKLARWSYIPKPGQGTLQKDHIYKNYYYGEQFPEIQDLTFTIIGNPYGDWTTTDATHEGYWY